MNTTVIIADDRSNFRDELRKILDTRPDIELLGEAETVEALLDLTSRLQPDVIIVDIDTPALGGFQTIYSLLRKVPTVKVIAMSMKADRRYVEQGLILGLSGYLLKDCACEELAEAIRMAAPDRKYVSRDLGPQPT